MKLFNYALSPLAARVRLSIYRKGLDVEIIPPPEGGLKSDAFLSLNPMGACQRWCSILGSRSLNRRRSRNIWRMCSRRPCCAPRSPRTLHARGFFLRLTDIYFENAPRVLMGMRDPATRKPEVVEASMAALNRGLSCIDHFVDAKTYAVGDKASIADCALMPVLSVVSRVGRVYGLPVLIDAYKNLGAYWHATQMEEINARVIAEQRAVEPK
jgi:glutathione S-transferase